VAAQYISDTIIIAYEVNCPSIEFIEAKEHLTEDFMVEQRILGMQGREAGWEGSL